MNSICHTFTGTFDPFNPRVEDVKVEDIAHHLAMICRFGGATPVYYSVAQHAVRVALLVETMTGVPEWAFHALHHDSAEAYVGDQRRPIKKLLRVGRLLDTSPFDHFELQIFGTILQAFGLVIQPEIMAIVNAADEAMLRAEKAGLFNEHDPGGSIKAAPVTRMDTWGWSRAERMFLQTHNRLWKAMQKAKAAA